MIPRQRIPLKHLLLFGWMPSPLKKLAYRVLLGYRIGRHVRFSFGGVVVGRSVRLADHVEIGLFAIVMGRTITIGRHSSVGAMSYVACTTIEIGEDARIREQVFVGGPQLPESRFALGNRTIVLQMAYINPTKPVVIGDDSGVGGHCLIFTHSAWLNALDGYPVTYKPVTLGKSVWLPWRVFLMPGTTIGDGSIIRANSVVSGTIPPNAVAGGSPAKVLMSAPDFPRRLTDADRAQAVETMVSEFDRYVSDEGIVRREEPPYRVYARERRSWRLLWSRHGDGGDLAPARGDTVLSEHPLGASALAAFRSQGVHWLDLGGRTRSRDGSPLTEELASFLGRYGIRLARDA
jgi:acetyltransferase-like isoleucine patch superfamily enzyme